MVSTRAVREPTVPLSIATGQGAPSKRKNTLVGLVYIKPAITILRSHGCLLVPVCAIFYVQVENQ
jgi:hypothetical protein